MHIEEARTPKMTIDGRSFGVPPTPATREAIAHRERPFVESPSYADDTTRLSTLGEMLNSFQTGNTARSQKLRALSHQIVLGGYHVSSEVLSRRLVGEMLNRQ
jgi:hypothetical protein